MKRFTAWGAIALTLLLSLASCTAGMGDTNAMNRYTPEVDYIVTDQGTFRFREAEGDTAVLVSYEGKATRDDRVVIPEKFGDRPVTAIGTEAFYNLAALIEVTIPDTVVTIGRYAFASCAGLTDVRLPAGTERIDDFAFANCANLKSVRVGDALTSIGSFAFWNCPLLESVPLPGTLATIGDGAFGKCAALPSLDVPASVSEIGELAFYDCVGLETIRLHDGIQRIGDYAFVTAKTTLKDRMDLSGCAKDGYVAQYVARMAETETETETGTAE